MTKSFAPHIELIEDALRYIRAYQPADLQAFRENTMAQDAILMRMQVIGENLSAMRRIDEAGFSRLSDPSWDKFIGLRNIISHGYHHIDVGRIWQILEDELPNFAHSIERLGHEP